MNYKMDHSACHLL